MTASEYVRYKISNGQKCDVIRMLKDFCENLDRTKTRQHHEVYWFANSFLISVIGELQHVNSIEDIDSNEFLLTWKNLGWFGIDRFAVAEMTNLTS